MGPSFEKLIAEAESAPIDGWDFSWLDGRATEERPSWHYAQLVGQRFEQASRALDLQSGGGELLAGLPRWPDFLVATEGYRPNVTVASHALRRRGGHVVAADSDRPVLPFVDQSFDLITSRHPIETWWEEIARVLRPGGIYLSQQVGPFSVQEVSEFFLGPSDLVSRRDPQRARALAEAAGLHVVDLREERLRTVFYDIGAVVYFLRLVVWIVPYFSVEQYRERLRALHEEIQTHGSFVAYAARFLVEAAKSE